MTIRHAECLMCHHKWDQPVRLSPHTPNLSGEATVWCPNCGSRMVVQGPHVEVEEKP